MEAALPEKLPNPAGKAPNHAAPAVSIKELRQHLHNQYHQTPRNLPPLLASVPLPPAAMETPGGRRPARKSDALLPARRPDSGGRDGAPLPLLANHFRVEFDPSQTIFQYDVSISPRPSKEVARIIKRRMVEENPSILSDSLPVFDGRRNLYSPIEFQSNKIKLEVNLPTSSTDVRKTKLFTVNIKLVSKMTGEQLQSYLSKEVEIQLPQEYLQALDVTLRETPTEICIPKGRSLYSGDTTTDIGGGAIGLRGFFQSLRPTQQGLSLNVDLSVGAFHESIGVISYLAKRCEFLRDLRQRKNRALSSQERRAVEISLKNIRVTVSHRDSDQRYRIYSLTEATTAELRFKDKDGKEIHLVDYYKQHYNHEIEFRNLPCLQIRRSKPCYLPMELCVVSEGQNYLPKLTDDQSGKILKMGCYKPEERKELIDAVMAGPTGPTCRRYTQGFSVFVSPEMTQLQGRVLQPPKLRFGPGGHVRDLTPARQDRQWNLSDSHVKEGTQIRRWALISFGGTAEQRCSIPNFISQLCHRCEKLGIFLNRTTVGGAMFESIQLLSNPPALEKKITTVQQAAAGRLQLLVCVMEKKHKGYADLKRIAETSVGVVSQCCLYSNLNRSSLQFFVNLALKINAKIGGCNVDLYNGLPCQIPRIFVLEEPVMFMGADVTHPHPLDDYSPSVAAVVGSVNWPSASKYISRMRSQTHRQEIIQDLQAMVRELLEEFHHSVRKLPSRILFFRDGVSETQFEKVRKEEVRAIKNACGGFSGYDPPVTFTVVQKRHHTRLFRQRGYLPEQNVPPGTVVDAVITHPREFDFYLCTHWGAKGTSRPTHYHVLSDENGFTSDELQRLIHNSCYTFAKCTKPVSLIPPAYYAHLAAYRGRLYLDRCEVAAAAAAGGGNGKLSRAGPPPVAAPLPELRDNLKKLMFYC